MTKREGVLVDTWYWEYEGVKAMGSAEDPEDAGGDDEGEARPARPKLVKGTKVPIEVRLLKEFDERTGPPKAVKDVTFRVGCAALNIWLVGTDIEVLRQVLWGKLDKRLEIVWEEYVLVQIGNAHGFFATKESGLALGETSVWKGTAHDGTLLLREIARHDRTSKLWVYRPWPGEYTTKDGEVIACIPASEKNRRALREFHARIDQLREVLATAIRPESILKTLANLSAATALPAPSKASGAD